jgi:hypothetical protein
MATVAVVGVIAIETRVAAVTVRVAVLLVMADIVAVILLEPADTPVAMPVEAIVATPVEAECHVTEVVRFMVLLSL